MKPILCAVPEHLPEGDVLEYHASTDGRFSSGFWSSGVVTIAVNYTEDEFCFLLAGEVRLIDLAGNESRFEAGQGFIIPAGFQGTWESLTPVRKLYALYQK